MTRTLGSLAWLLAISCLAGEVAAQVPEGSYVLARAADPINGLGGISILHPRNATAPVEVTGVPLMLVGATSMPGSGASAVVVEPGPNGRIFAGNVPGNVGWAVWVFALPLAGTTVTVMTPYYLGAAASVYGGVTQIADFGSFLVAAVNGLTNATPLFGAKLAYIDKATGTVSPIPLTGLPVIPPGGNPIFTTSMTINAIAKAGPPAMPNSLLYLGVVDSAAGVSRIFSVPATGGTPSLFVPYSYTGILTNMSVKPTGEIYSAFNNSSGTNVWAYNAVNPPMGSGGFQVAGGGLNGIATEWTTYGYVVLQAGGPTGYQAQAWHPIGSGPNPSFFTTTTLATATAGTATSGTYTGIDWNPTPTVYGAGTAGANSYSWDPNDFWLGMPSVGSDFTLRATSAPGIAPGWFVVSFAPASLTAFGVNILVDPSSLIEMRLVYPGASWIPMSSYMVPIAVGTTFHCQTFWFEPTGLAASPGVRFRVQ